MKTTDLSRIYASVPLNGTAASVTSNSRQHWGPKPRLGNYEHWESPPPIIHPSKYPKTETFKDLRGEKMGWFTVVGFLGKSNPKKSARWLLKCSCGHYEARSAKAVKAAASATECCLNCRYQRRLREGWL